MPDVGDSSNDTPHFVVLPEVKPGQNCCGKPHGCSNTNPGCLYLRHPWKRVVLYGEKVCWRCGGEVACTGLCAPDGGLCERCAQKARDDA